MLAALLHLYDDLQLIYFNHTMDSNFACIKQAIMYTFIPSNAFRVGKMLGSNKDGADLTRSSKRNERTDDLTGNSNNIGITCSTRSSAKKNRICNGGEQTESLISGDLHRNSNQGALSELREQVTSSLSKSVVSIALFDGKRMLFAISGIPVKRLGNVTRFVTSARLGQAFNDKKRAILI